MRRLAINAAIALALGAGLTLALLWTLGAPFPRTIHAQGNTTRYVALSGEDSGDCSDSADPCRTVQYAVDQAASGDEIRVAAGIYAGVRSRAGVAQVVYISKTVTIRGGYTTTDWTTPDPDANPTTLDAQEKGRVLYIAGDISPTIEGLRIINGDAEGLGGGPWSAADAGGGVYINSAGVVISNSKVLNGVARYGGGLYLRNSPAVLMKDTIAGNRADWGAGVTLYASDEAFLGDNTVAYNEASSVGGGVYLRGSGATLSGNTVFSNSAGYGGGAYLRGSGATLSANAILSNTAEEAGGGVYVQQSEAVLQMNTVSANMAKNAGGGIYVLFSAAALRGNVVSGNEARERGGGLYVQQSDATLVDNTVCTNSAKYYGGGLFLYKGADTLNRNTACANSAFDGGAVYLYNSDATLINSIIADNRSQRSGSGVTIDAGAPRLLHTTLARNTSTVSEAALAAGNGSDTSGIYVAAGSVGLTNTILVSHTTGIYVASGGEARLKCTLWGADTWANDADWAGRGTIITGTPVCSIWAPPTFVAPDAGDYHIRWASAARDRGVNAGVTSDIDGQPRPMPIEGGPDLGADECTVVDLSPSRKMASPRQVDAGGVLTYTVVLLNSGPLSAANTLLFDAIPPRTTYISGSAASGVLTYVGGIRWTGTVMPHEPVTVTYWVTVNEKAFVENTALVTDQYGTMTTLRAWVNGWRSYLPFILRESKGL